MCISNKFPNDAGAGPHLRAPGLSKQYSNWDMYTFRDTEKLFQGYSGVDNFNGIKVSDPQFLYYSFLIIK